MVRRYGSTAPPTAMSRPRCRALGQCRPIEELKIITCHLGGGSSMAVDGGRAWTPPWASPPGQARSMGTCAGDPDAVHPET